MDILNTTLGTVLEGNMGTPRTCIRTHKIARGYTGTFRETHGYKGVGMYIYIYTYICRYSLSSRYLRMFHMDIDI